MDNKKKEQVPQAKPGKKDIYLYPAKRLLARASEQKEEKRCPFLDGKYSRICKALPILLSPDQSCLEKYCENGRYKECTIYRNAIGPGQHKKSVGT